MALPADLPRSQLSAVVYRVVRGGVDPLGTAGSLKAGGRYNPPGGFGALYTSLDAGTAAAEVAKSLRTRGINPGEYPAGAWWTYEVEVKLDAVLDLTDADVLRRLGIPANALTGSDIRETRRIAAEARRAGFQAVLAPSAATAGGRNLIIFADHLAEMPVVLSSRPVDLGDS